MKRIVFYFLFLLFISIKLASQATVKKMSEQEYIEKYKEEAVKEMLLNKIPASITLAQGMLESANGNSRLAVNANNHFGIKCHKTWSGPVIIHDDDEKNECFRKYSTAFHSYQDHSYFLLSRPWYKPLFQLRVTDYKSWAVGLKKSGYATNPKYAERLIQLIEEYRLYQFDYVNELPNINAAMAASISKEIKKNVSENDILFNGLKYVVANEGASFYKIAMENDIELGDLHRYNDLSTKERSTEPQIVYIQPKKNNAKQLYHVVKDGEDLRFISQLYGIKLKKLYKRNGLKEGQNIKPGDKIALKTATKKQEG